MAEQRREMSKDELARLSRDELIAYFEAGGSLAAAFEGTTSNPSARPRPVELPNFDTMKPREIAAWISDNLSELVRDSQPAPGGAVVGLPPDFDAMSTVEESVAYLRSADDHSAFVRWMKQGDAQP
jgi:hypothetical protein